MSSNSSRDATSRGVAVARALRVLAPAALVLPLLSVPVPVDASATLPEMARLETADRLDRIQVDRLARWYGTLGLAREAAEFVERRIRAGDLSREEAAPILESVVRGGSRRGNVQSLLAACDTAVRNGNAGPAVVRACADGLRRDGRLDAAADLLSRIAPHDASFPEARFAFGQIATARGDLEEALGIFGDVERAAAARGRAALAARARLAAADLRVVAGQLHGEDPGAPRAALPDDPSPRRQVAEGIRAGDAALGRGEIDEAVAAFRRALAAAKAALAAPLPSDAGVARAMAGPPETFRLLLAAHEDAERVIARNAAGGASPSRAGVRDLLADVLALGFVLDRAEGSLPQSGASPRGPFLSPARRNALFRMTEEITFEGMDVERLLAKSGESVEVFENIAHPIRRYRSLADLEARQVAMNALAGRATKSREALVAALEGAGGADLVTVLRALGTYLGDLDRLRTEWDGTRDLVRGRFDIFPKGRDRETGDDAAAVATRKGMVCEGAETVALRRLARSLEERARSVARERERGELAALRSAAAGRSVEALLGQARLLEERRPDGWQPRFRQILGDAVGILQVEPVGRAFRSEWAVRIGSLAVARLSPWERFPETASRGPEDETIRNLLSMLPGEAGEAGPEGGALWISALLRWRIGDPGAAPAARALLARYPSSPMAGHMALRLGHDAVRAKRWKEAAQAYRDAAGRGPAEAAASARLMLGWLALRDGDAGRALRELEGALPASHGAGPDLRAIEDDAVSLVVRCWLKGPGEGVPAYGPVRDRTRIGKRILGALASAESRRGRAGRAAELFSAVAALYAADGDGMAYELRSVESLARGGMQREALAKAVEIAHRLRGRAAPADAAPDGRREEDAAALARLLRELSGRRFAEGTRSGGAAAMSEAAAGFGEYFALVGPGSGGGDPELRLSRAVATLKAGDRAEGLRLLDEILSGTASGTTAERAALMRAEASIAGYVAGDVAAPRAEESLQLLLRRFPGEKAVALGIRAATAFLDAGDAARAARAATEAAGSAKATAGTRAEARLLRARALLVSGDFAAARAAAAEVLATPPGTSGSDATTHARDMLVLATRKEAAARSAAGDRIGAAALLEELVARFPDMPDAADRILDAFGDYRDAPDAEATLRTGTAFLRRFPDRSEGVDVASTIGPLLEARGRRAEAARLYARVSERFPRDGNAPRLLFRAAGLAEKDGDREGARRWYAAYAGRYRDPLWASACAALSAGLLTWSAENSSGAIRAVERALRLAESAGAESHPELAERVDRARIAVGDYWADRFGRIPLARPLEKSLARKQLCFRNALAAYGAAGGSAAPAVWISASRSSGDLFVAFGRAILESERPRGMSPGEREAYENALTARSRKYVERGLEDYAAALGRLRADGMPANLAEPFLQRVDAAGRMLSMPPEARVRR